jgi:hypothetical protein
MLKDVCISNLYEKNLERYRPQIQAVCTEKYDKTGWKDFCACFRPTGFYEDLSEAIAKQWDGPSHAMSSRPECIFPKCRASRFANAKADCGSVSFAKCIQNNNLDITDSTVGKIKIDSSISGCGSFTPKKDDVPEKEFVPETAPPSLPDLPGMDGGGVTSDEGEEDNTKKYLAVLFFLVLVISVVWYIRRGRTRKKKPSSNYSGGIYYNST